MTASVRRLADRMLTAAAVLGLLAVVAAVLGVVLGVRPLLFRSGSMAPTIPSGSVALAREVSASELRVGDVVSVRTAAGERVTHRVTRVQDDGSTATLTLRGDANAAADPEGYTVASAYRVFWHVPDIGYAVAAVRSLPGRVALGLVAAAVLLRLPERREAGGRRRAGRQARRPAGRHRGGRRAAVAVATATMLAGPAGPASAAPWTDAVPISSTTFTAGSVATPTLSCGALGVLSVTFSWTAVSGATDYTLHYGIGGASTLTVGGTSYTFLTAISGGTAWVVANHAYGSTTWSSAASNTRTYTVAAVSLCA